MGRWVARAGLVCAAAGALWWVVRSESEPPAGPSQSSRGETAARAERAALPQEESAPGSGALPPGPRLPISEGLPEFLRDKPVVGALEVDAQGKFRPTPRARHLFEHFFLASGLASEEEMRSWIEAEIRSRLDPPAEAEALEALRRYAELRDVIREISTWEEDLERRLQRIMDLRRSVLGPELAQAFFAEEEQQTRVDLELRAIRQDATLTPEQREQRIAEAERQLPPDVLSGRRAVRAPGRVQGEVERLREAGASDAEVFALRERELGRDAAERLAELDDRQARRAGAWDAYRPLRDALLAAPGLSEEQRQGDLEALRRRFFSSSELDQVRLQDRVEIETGVSLP